MIQNNPLSVMTLFHQLIFTFKLINVEFNQFTEDYIFLHTYC